MAVDLSGIADPVTALNVAEVRRRRRAMNGTSLQLWLSASVLVLVALACFIGPLVFSMPSPNYASLEGASPFLSAGHLFGTDDLGRDILSRVLYGGRVSFEVGFGSVAIGFLIGGTLGLCAGYLGGKVDVVIARVLDTFLAFPALVLALAVATYLGPNERDEIFAIAFFTIPGYGRYTRGAAVRLREEEFLSANQMLGGRSAYILFRHVLPNIVGTLITFGFLTVAAAMLAEAGLSFLGAGIRPPAPSWGNMIVEGQSFISDAPHIFLVPSVFLFVTILSLNLVGDALRRRLHV
jgi:peptide/nickel transport system permease protein